MKKVLIALVAVCTLLFVSCSKESEYTVTYEDNVSSFANLTVFEYDWTDSLIAIHEVKNVQNLTYSFISKSGTDYVVLGVEMVVAGKIMELYSADKFYVDSDNMVNIYFNPWLSNTLNVNPIHPEDIITRYLYK